MAPSSCADTATATHRATFSADWLNYVRGCILVVSRGLLPLSVWRLLRQTSRYGTYIAHCGSEGGQADVWQSITEQLVRRIVTAFWSLPAVREGQKELHCVFVDLEKAYDKVPREEVWYCMRTSGLAGKYVRIVQDMYDGSTAAVRCAVGVTEGFEVKVGLHQGSALSPCLFAMVMDRMTDDIREEAPWTMMFADDIVICSESKEQV